MMFRYETVIAILSFISFINSEEIDPSLLMAETYLTSYGYLAPANSEKNETISEEAIKNAIKKFQQFFRLNITGEVDDPTSEMMSYPRCSFPDIFINETIPFLDRYVSLGSKWHRNDLTFKITNIASNIHPKIVESETIRAFEWWSDVSPLKFTSKTSGTVNIDIRFTSIDGPDGILGFAYPPITSGKIVIDDDEDWTSYSYSGKNLHWTLVHEIGHSLGLGHSSNMDALMAPIPKPIDPFTAHLHIADMNAIQALYGPKRK